MNLKNRLISSALLAASMAANAVVTNPVQVNGPSFQDVELGLIVLNGVSDIVGDLGFAQFLPITPNFSIPLPVVVFVSIAANDVSQPPAMVGTLSGGSFSFDDLAAGSYSLRVSGTLTGTNFIAAQYTVTAVPEPEALVMLLAGLGVVGGFARRRSSTTQT